MSHFDDHGFDDYGDEMEWDDFPKCYRCNETCYWEDRQLYDFDVDTPHVCKDKMMATSEDFED